MDECNRYMNDKQRRIYKKQAGFSRFVPFLAGLLHILIGTRYLPIAEALQPILGKMHLH